MVNSRKIPNGINTLNPREAAFLAAFYSVKEMHFASDSLEQWRKNSSPKQPDYHLARELAFGSIRMALALDYLAAHLTEQKKLNVKVGEKVLIRQAIYQVYYMDRIPLHAIVNETVSIAKKYFHGTFANFLNAILRKLSQEKPELPQEDSISSISIRYSYPEYLVKQLIEDYGIEQTKKILEIENQPSSTMFKIRQANKNSTEMLGGVYLKDAPCPFAVLKDFKLLSEIASSPNYYIQNVTPAVLIQNLSQHVQAPKKILDLCSSPGGKLLAVHDAFPDAELTANDVSQEKLKVLEENCAKYGIKASLNCGLGEEFFDKEKFDIIILDVPCSNSGVLNKRVEARWRLSSLSIQDLDRIQMNLLRNACKLLSANGQIWYLTCSILKQENEHIIERAAKELGLSIISQQTILPNQEGWDGGFAAALSRR